MSPIPMRWATGDCLTRPGDGVDGNDLFARTHQAIEAKEGLKLTQEHGLWLYYYQNLFKMFRKLGGMTGT